MTKNVSYKNINSGGLKEVKTFYQSQGYGGGIEKGEQVYCLNYQNNLVGACKLEQLAGGDSCLRGIYLDTKFRGNGLGGLLVEHILKQTSNAVYCLPKSHLRRFYKQFGFEIVSELPAILDKRLSAYVSAGLDVIAMKREAR